MTRLMASPHAHDSAVLMVSCICGLWDSGEGWQWCRMQLERPKGDTRAKLIVEEMPLARTFSVETDVILCCNCPGAEGRPLIV
jgi:hypothetical protein